MWCDDAIFLTNAKIIITDSIIYCLNCLGIRHLSIVVWQYKFIKWKWIRDNDKKNVQWGKLFDLFNLFHMLCQTYVYMNEHESASATHHYNYIVYFIFDLFLLSLSLHDHYNQNVLLSVICNANGNILNHT